ncbi:hypothetical protein AVEN_46684-1 [Araneus ventricosus]|uniref:Uncharacterized protein n=1 Tax=Araneus ventricosus TaxID=182803 RepID=A0A4Y2PGS4_ARAVE|nr:hypothetical protein AVEN_45071-1 [Araneus ventricosus]GBN49670.1 hypothetical protein AVEN_46684-1 [Araneus ventricosus]
MRLTDGGHGLVRDVDAVGESEVDEPGMEAGPEPGVRHLVAAGHLEARDLVEELEQHLMALVGDVAAAQHQPLHLAHVVVGEVADHVVHVVVPRPEQAQGVEAALLEAGVHLWTENKNVRDHGS